MYCPLPLQRFNISAVFLDTILADVNNVPSKSHKIIPLCMTFVLFEFCTPHNAGVHILFKTFNIDE